MAEVCMRDPVQIVLVLDVGRTVTDDEIRSALPRCREAIHVLRLSELCPHGLHRLGSDTRATDWTDLAGAVARMVARAQEVATSAQPPIDYYITGDAPLPAFTHVGAALNTQAHTVTVLIPHHDQTWVAVPLGATTASAGEPFFDVVPQPDSSPLRTDGRIAVWVSCGLPIDLESIRRLFRDRREWIGDIVQIRTSEAREVNAEVAAVAGKQITDIFSTLRAKYPDSSKLAVAMAGSAQLALLVGRALQAMNLEDVWVADVGAGTYDFAFNLPFRGHRQPRIGQRGEDENDRRFVLNAFEAGLQRFRARFNPTYLPESPFPMSKDGLNRFQDLVQHLSLEVRNEDDEPFQLPYHSHTLSISLGMLEALRSLLKQPVSAKQPQTELMETAQYFMIHELFRASQGLYPTYHHGIARAHLVLEELDCWSDAFALGLLSMTEVRYTGPRGLKEIATITTEVINAALRGLEAADRFQHGDRMSTLQARRLRRYLALHLQRVRAQTLPHLNPARNPKDPLADRENPPADLETIWLLFGRRVVVELAPLDGYLDPRLGEVVVDAPVPNDAELFVMLDARIIPVPRAQVDPGELVEAARTFKLVDYEKRISAALGGHPAVLMPWRRELMTHADAKECLIRASDVLPEPIRPAIVANTLADARQDLKLAAGGLPADTAPGSDEPRYDLSDADIRALAEACARVQSRLHASSWWRNLRPARITTLVMLLYDHLRFGIDVSADDGLVLLVLKDAPPRGWQPAELLDQLPDGYPAGSAIAEILQGLRDARTGYGDPAKLVAVKEGRWRGI